MLFYPGHKLSVRPYVHVWRLTWYKFKLPRLLCWPNEQISHRCAIIILLWHFPYGGIISCCCCCWCSTLNKIHSHRPVNYGMYYRVCLCVCLSVRTEPVAGIIWLPVCICALCVTKFQIQLIDRTGAMCFFVYIAEIYAIRYTHTHTCTQVPWRYVETKTRP